MKKILYIIAVILALGSLVFLTACSGVKIRDILKNPDAYKDKEVRVAGTVTDRYWVDILGIKAGAYYLDDDTGAIWIITKEEPPAEGERASARGKVSTAGKIGERSFGTVIIESPE